MESKDTRRRLKRYKKRFRDTGISSNRCYRADEMGLMALSRGWEGECLDDSGVHCGHGDPVQCCTCGKYEDPLLEAMARAATQDK